MQRKYLLLVLGAMSSGIVLSYLFLDQYVFIDLGEKPNSEVKDRFLAENKFFPNVFTDLENKSNSEVKDRFLTENKFFPNITPLNFSVYLDPDSSEILWNVGAGGIQRVNIKTKEIEEFGNKIKASGEIAKIGNLIFIGDREQGLVQYDLSSGKRKVYTTNDGLLTESNLHLSADPYDKDVLWIDTFKGLNRLKISTGKLSSFTKEMGIKGSQWESSIFNITNDEVWLTVGADAYSSGGVSVYNKNTGMWKSWGPESFFENDRFDGYGIGKNENIFVYEDDTLYKYDKEKDKWERFDFSEDAYLIGLKNGNIYFSDTKTDDIFVYDIALQQVRPFFDKNMLLEWEHKFLDGYEYYFDFKNDRILISDAYFSEHYNFHSKINSYSEIGLEIRDWHMNLLYEIPASLFYDKYGIIGAKTLDAQDNLLLLKTKYGLYSYDLKKNSIKFLVKGIIHDAALFGDTAIIFDFFPCEMLCDHSYSTTTVLSLSSSLEPNILVLDDYYPLVISPEELYLVKSYFSETKYIHDMYSFSSTTKSFIHTGITNELPLEKNRREMNVSTLFVYQPIPSMRFVYEDYQKGDSIEIKIDNNLSSTTSIKSPVGPGEKNPFGWFPSTKLKKVLLDPYDSSLWIGTNRGLVIADLNNLNTRLYTTENGLSSNIIEDIHFTKDFVIIDDTTGVHVYSR